MSQITFAFCTYNRADRLERLVAALRAQSCSVPFEILAINNNSTDATSDTLARLALLPGVRLRWVTETVQGIVPARNRAIEESLESDILVFIDDDELPLPGLLEAASNAVLAEGADCVGGPIKIEFEPFTRPKWLDDELAGFLGALDYGPTAFWVRDAATPLWSGNIAYRMQIFRDRPDLRFDPRYNREGAGIGGGSDAIMFRNLLKNHYKIRYRPDMVIKHLVDDWKLKRGYFLRLHYRAGLRHGRYQLPDYRRTLFGIPPFLAIKFLKQSLSSAAKQCLGRSGALRHGMNAANTLGMMAGYRRRPADRR